MEDLIKLRFATHFAIVLMLTGRITQDVVTIENYNKII